MDNKISHEKILIIIAIVLCAFIIGYNAFFIPEISIPAVVYVDNSDREALSGDENGENASEESESEHSDNKNTKASSSVNINTASANELAEALDGVGPALAQRIVDYRENVSEFKLKQDIKNVKGIGDKLYEKIEKNIVV